MKRQESRCKMQDARGKREDILTHWNIIEDIRRWKYLTE